MSEFLSWFYEFLNNMLGGFAKIFTGLFSGIGQIFNIGAYIHIFQDHSDNFTIMNWVLAILSILLIIFIWVAFFYVIGHQIRKYIKMRRHATTQEKTYEEIADLNRQVLMLNDQKDKMMALIMSKGTITPESLAGALNSGVQSTGSLPNSENNAQQTAKPTPQVAQSPRFFRLTEVDEKYRTYVAPEHYSSGNLQDLCKNLRNFACKRMNLYYDEKTIRCFVSSMAATKLILLQGISGTGKTSLPYMFGKFLTHDTTIASVQPSWRDRNELFGYFNEFTKKFNETEVLRRIYEASYTDDVNLIILDEMNIARVEYYFAEMLSILEMPDTNEWKLDLVANSWSNDPLNLVDGKLKIPDNLWYIGTANNDDSTFSISDKVYDRAFTINLDSKGEPFECDDAEPEDMSHEYLESLFKKAQEEHPISQENLELISKLDIFVIQKFRIAFGNRIVKQLKIFTPVYVACGGSEIDAIDYVLSTKVIRKFESLNLSLMRDELQEMSVYLTKLFGKDNMLECKAYLKRLEKFF